MNVSNKVCVNERTLSYGAKARRNKTVNLQTVVSGVGSPEAMVSEVSTGVRDCESLLAGECPTHKHGGMVSKPSTRLGDCEYLLAGELV